MERAAAPDFLTLVMGPFLMICGEFESYCCFRFDLWSHVWANIVSAVFKRPQSRFCLSRVSGGYWQLSETISGTRAKKNSVYRVLAQRLYKASLCVYRSLITHSLQFNLSKNKITSLKQKFRSFCYQGMFLYHVNIMHRIYLVKTIANQWSTYYYTYNNLLLVEYDTVVL